MHRTVTFGAVAVLLTAGAVPSGPVSRVSVAAAGAQADGTSFGTGLSRTGRYVAFSSEATNLVPGDTNNASDVFVRDRGTGTTERVSVSSHGSQGDEESFGTSITPDGRYVAFASRATGLVPGDTNGQTDAFLHDRDTGTTVRVSVATGGGQGNSESTFPVVSADGQHVAFRSWATDLVPGDTTAEANDIFVRDVAAGTTERVSISTLGAQADGDSSDIAISRTGRHVAFVSSATNLVPGDTNAAGDVFTRDRQIGITTRVNVDNHGNEANGDSSAVSMTPDAACIAFDSVASNMVPDGVPGPRAVYVRNLGSLMTDRIGTGTNPSLSADCGVVAYHTRPDPTSEHEQVFAMDRATRVTTLVSTARGGGPADGFSYQPAVSGDGAVVAFHSSATNLVRGDTNGAGDLFARRLG